MIPPNDCTLCPLHENRTRVVQGMGPTDPLIIIIGEAPGKTEDEGGEPFTGRSGTLLNALLLENGFDRSKNVYITNTCKCRPPNNRTPKSNEISACLPYLMWELGTLRPMLVICVGLTPARAVINKKLNMGESHGKIFTLENGLPAMATYHPASALRTPAHKLFLAEDIQKAGRFVMGQG